ncbi:MAG: hypothetical protein HY699_22985 [Deltaproteobacteria bacterium]|nr:hypothetical protein [Deltaproteobacteria bacterium]
MELKNFAKYLKGKPLPELLHRARKESLRRILAQEDIGRPRRPAPKRAGAK